MEQKVYDLSHRYASVTDVLRHDDPWVSVEQALGSASVRELAGVQLKPPVDPWTRTFLVAANYRPHAQEAGLDVPAHPLLFTKFPESLVGHEEAIVLPSISDKMDYEGELAVVIGKGGSRIPAERAMDHVAGYTIVNDVTARDLQWTMLGKNRVVDWLSSKMLDASSPMGPGIIPARAIPDPHRLTLKTHLNGQIMQDSSTSLMVFKVPQLIEYLSARIALRPGDIIATGTPFGVGGFREIFLKDGDMLEVTIEGIGTLRNQVKAAR